MKLELLARNKKHSRKNDKRFYTALDMAIIKHDAAVRNAKIKRGELQKGKLDYISVCGCGHEGCFIHGSVPRDKPTPKVTKVAPWKVRQFVWGKGT